MHILYYESFLKYTRGMNLRCTIDVILTLLRAICPAVVVAVVATLGAISGIVVFKVFAVIAVAISA